MVGVLFSVPLLLKIPSPCMRSRTSRIEFLSRYSLPGSPFRVDCDPKGGMISHKPHFGRADSVSAVVASIDQTRCPPCSQLQNYYTSEYTGRLLLLRCCFPSRISVAFLWELEGLHTDDCAGRKPFLHTAFAGDPSL